jgi:acyl-CoA synthetase (AMP-forming)/AMP-acid ligase II
MAELLGPERVTDLDDRGALGGGGRPVARPTTTPATTTPDDEAVLVFSSGTTGFPKAVRHTHRSLGHATRHWVECLGLGPDDRFQIATPPSHILGLLNLLAAAHAGATLRLHPRFDLDELLRHIQDERMTLEMAVAPIALALANHPDLESYDLSSLRYIMWGATPVTARVAEIVTERTGVRWLPAYGASELPVIACNPVERLDEWRLDSAGLPPPDVELRVVDLDSGEVLAPGELGEIQVSSPSVMAGYLPEEATAEAFDDGWYRTGDVGWLEAEGWVHLTDRSKEMIKVKGFQVAPAEVEAVLLSHPAVVDCAVFGVPDDRTGEAVAAAVQVHSTVDVSDEHLTAYVAERLSSYKRITRLHRVPGIPRLPSGKALRRVLRDELRSSPG